mgnify:CR=1 FL=1
MKIGPKKNQKIDFYKVPILYAHDMGCFGTGLGMLFHPYKGLLVTYEVFNKIEKNSFKISQNTQTQ